jgi:hypothetical protein
MNETRQSLLLRAQNGETNAWKDLTDLYRPLIIGWLNRQGVPAADLEDLSQEVQPPQVRSGVSARLGMAAPEQPPRRQLGGGAVARIATAVAG